MVEHVKDDKQISISNFCNDCLGKHCCSIKELIQSEYHHDLIDNILLRANCKYFKCIPGQNTAHGYSSPKKFQTHFDQCNVCNFKDVCKYDKEKLTDTVNKLLDSLNNIRPESLIVEAACQSYSNELESYSKQPDNVCLPSAATISHSESATDEYSNGAKGIITSFFRNKT